MLPLSELNKFDATAGFPDVDAEESKAGAEAVLLPPPKSLFLEGSDIGAGALAGAGVDAFAETGVPDPKLNAVDVVVAGEGALAGAGAGVPDPKLNAVDVVVAGEGALAGAGAGVPDPKLNAVDDVVAGAGALAGAGAGVPDPKLNAVDDVVAGAGALAGAGAGVPDPKLNAVDDVVAGAGVDPKLIAPFPSVLAAVGALAVVVEPNLNVVGAGAKEMNIWQNKENASEKRL